MDMPPCSRSMGCSWERAVGWLILRNKIKAINKVNARKTGSNFFPSRWPMANSVPSEYSWRESTLILEVADPANRLHRPVFPHEISWEIGFKLGENGCRIHTKGRLQGLFP